MSGQWQDDAACMSPNGACLGGNCVECTPDQVRCSADLTSVQTCSMTGQWQTTATCQGPTCVDPPGQCMDAPDAGPRP
jgi:hypothetical protein